MGNKEAGIPIPYIRLPNYSRGVEPERPSCMF